MPLLSAAGATLAPPLTSTAPALRPDRLAVVVVDEGGGGGGVVELGPVGAPGASFTFPEFLLEFRLLDLSRKRLKSFHGWQRCIFSASPNPVDPAVANAPSSHRQLDATDAVADISENPGRRRISGFQAKASVHNVKLINELAMRWFDLCAH